MPPAIPEGQRTRLKAIVLAAVIVAAAAVGVATYAHISGAPKRAEAEYRAAQSLMTPGHYREAIEHFNRAVQISPDLNVYFERGTAYELAGETNRALEDLNHAVELEPRRVEIFNTRAEVYLRRGEIGRALAEYDESLNLQPSVDAHFQRAEIYSAQRDYPKAIDDYTWVLEHSVRSSPILRARARVLRNMGDDSGAKADLAEAAEFEHHSLERNRRAK